MLVGLQGDKVSLCTVGAAVVGVVSVEPAVCGNMPGPDASGHSVPVIMAGWSGQVDVLVSGIVELGDRLTPSGNGDGTAVKLVAAHGRSIALGIVEHVPEETARTADTSDVYSVRILMGAVSLTRA